MATGGRNTTFLTFWIPAIMSILLLKYLRWTEVQSLPYYYYQWCDADAAQLPQLIWIEYPVIRIQEKKETPVNHLPLQPNMKGLHPSRHCRTNYCGCSKKWMAYGDLSMRKESTLLKYNARAGSFHNCDIGEYVVRVKKNGKWGFVKQMVQKLPALSMICIPIKTLKVTWPCLYRT